MTDIKAIMELLVYNEEVARKFFEIEKRILTILDYTDLFEVLLNEIQDQFKVPYAWISLIDNSDLSSFLQTLESSESLRKRLNIIDRKLYEELVGSRISPLLINENLTPYRSLLPRDTNFSFNSLAIAPISLDGEVIGSLNQADTSREHFQPGIDTSLLEQLAVKVSLCLSNVTAHEKLRFLAYHDPLTGLLNRRVMESVLAREYSRARRYGKNLSVVFLDLDHFKHVNDVHGHDCGDHLLQHVAGILMERCRETDIVARYAGDEFVIILPEASLEMAEQLMERIRAHFKGHPLEMDAACISVSVSVGIASINDDGVDGPKTLLKKADERLYAQKKLPRSNEQGNF